MLKGSRVPLGRLLVGSKLVSEAQLNTALAEQRSWGGRLGEILVRMSYLSEELLVKVLSQQLGYSTVDLSALASVPRVVLDRVPRETARRCRAVPIAVRDDGRAVVMAMADPRDLKVLDELRSATGGARLVPVLAGPGAIDRAIVRLYDGMESLGEADGRMSMVDAQGRSYEPAPAPPSPVPPPARTPVFPVVGRGAASSAGELLELLGEQQARELQALRAVVDLLVEQGFFSREEYLARVRR